jgi:hypothetical protein
MTRPVKIKVDIKKQGEFMHHSNKQVFARPFRFACTALALLATLTLTGCVSAYIDPVLKDVKPEQMKVVADPKPVQLLFEFQTKGATNARVTEIIKKQVTELVQGSKLFSQVSDTPAPNGALLSIVINNVPLTNDAYGKGVAAGLTLGLAGSMVTDGYLCNFDYIPSTGAPKISRQLKHAIHTGVGNASPPKELIPVASHQEAATIMVRQVVMNGLNQIASDPSFK